MDCWNEMKTAYAVARLHTVSAAAQELKLHRATVIRHIDILEQHLGIRLFQRHSKGYSPTDTGKDLLRVASITDEHFKAFAGRAKGRSEEVMGNIIVTSVELLSPLVLQSLSKIREFHPNATLRYIVSGRLFNLSHGEAHIAIRVGQRPDHPDIVVRPFFKIYSTLYAHTSYIDKYGIPETNEDFKTHHFVTHDDPARTLFFQWLEPHINKQNLVLRSNNQRVLMESISMGLGIGFMPIHQGQSNPNLHQVIPPKDDWFIPSWLVTHMDIHRTVKVQAISKALSDISKEWSKMNQS